MSSIRVTRGGDVFRLPCNDTDTLLALLRRAGCTMPAACGGHGRCGKCRVSVNGVPRLACRVVPEDGDEIVLPPAAGGRILTETLDPPAGPTGETGCAAAIDLGTTTTALRLYDLATCHALATCADWTALAPYGADVITRIQYTIDHQDGLTRLSSLLRQQLKAQLTRALSQAGRQPAELKRTVTAGNTVMQSLLAGVSVRPLAAAPFCPETFFRQSSGLTLLDAPLYCVPCAAGFVGGDITAGLLASGLARRAGHFLFLDIGTNGEMALGGMDGFTCCAVAAGPAFEGAGIACGMLGVDGAVSRVRYSDAFKMTVIGGGEARSLCGSGLLDAVAALRRLELVEDSGFMEEDSLPLSGSAALLRRDIRAFQLAKSAICAGVDTLLHPAGVRASEVKTVWLAGGFGCKLSPESAGAVGMLPLALAPSVRPVGNAAAAGAALLLCSRRFETEAADITAAARVVELAADPVFQERFIEDMLLAEVTE